MSSNGYHANGDSKGEGGLSAQVGELNMADGRDRVLLRCRRWPTSADQRSRYLKALDSALSIAIGKEDERGITSCVKTIALLEGQNQADEHLADKNARLDADKPTEIIHERRLKLEFDDRD